MSTTRSRRFSRRYEARICAGWVPAWSRRSSAATTEFATRAPSRTSASSTHQAPSANPRARSAAIRRASRLFPAPPGPTRLTRRAAVSFFLISPSCWRRPTKLVISAGRLPDGRRVLAIVNTNLPRSCGRSPVDYPSNHQFRRFGRCGRSRRLTGVKELSNHRVDVTFVGRPPARKVALASGVTDVVVDGCRLQCQVWGSFQPFLEALHGSEVINLTSVPTSKAGD